MIQYLSKAKKYIKCFKNFKIQNIPQNQNQKADVLSKLASVAFNCPIKEILVEVLENPSTEMKEINAVVEEEGDNWITPIIKYLSKLCDTRNIHRSVQHAHEASGDSRKIYSWGMDVLGPLPESPGKVKFVIMAVDYFTKWIEAKPLAKTIGKEINTDVAHPQVNNPVERANRSLMKGIKTRLWRERKGWVDELPNVLWAFRTSLKISNGETPHSLAFGSEADIPVEIGMPTHRTMTIKEGTLNEEEIRLNLNLL
ncbi:reverse transcriptase domain-containing protein [Tanacetum coccineum]